MPVHVLQNTLSADMKYDTISSWDSQASKKDKVWLDYVFKNVDYAGQGVEPEDLVEHYAECRGGFMSIRCAGDLQNRFRARKL